MGSEPAARIDDPVAWDRRVVAAMHRESSETRGPRVAGDHRDHSVGRDAATGDATHDVAYAFVSLVDHVR